MPTLQRAIDTFLLFKEAEAITPRTLAWYATSLSNFRTWICARSPQPLLLNATDTVPLRSIKPIDIAEYLVHEQQRGLSTLTVEGCYRALLAFFNWCEYAEAAGCVPSPIGHGQRKAVKRPKVDQPGLNYVTFEEYITLSHAIDLGSWLDYRDWSLIGVLFWCGVRRGELLQMEVRDLNRKRHEIRIRQSKARRQRTIFLLDDLLAGICRYLELRPTWQGPALWVAYDKARVKVAGALSETGLRNMLKRRCQKAELRFLNPHLFRHGFAMCYLNHGADLKAVGTLMGHASYKTTERHYAHWLDGPLRDVHRQTAARIVASIAIV